MKAYTTEELNEIIDKPHFDDERGIYLNRDMFKAYMIANGHRKEDNTFGRAYTNESGKIVTFIDENTAFGFDSDGKWVKWYTFVNFNEWQPYPQEKWEAMLLEYAKSRGYKNGNFESLLFGLPYNVEIEFFIGGRNNDVWIGKKNGSNKKIFDSKTGAWAEIIEPKEEKDHFVDAIRFNFGIDFANVESEPKGVVFSVSHGLMVEEEPKYTIAEMIEKLKQMQP